MLQSAAEPIPDVGIGVVGLGMRGSRAELIPIGTKRNPKMYKAGLSFLDLVQQICHGDMCMAISVCKVS